MCSVDLRGTSDAAEDEFSEFSAAQVAYSLVEECVVLRSNLGGQKSVGPRKVFRMFIMHKDILGLKQHDVLLQGSEAAASGRHEII